MGTKVQSGDHVCVDGNPICEATERPIYIALNKPTASHAPRKENIAGNIVDFIGHKKRIFPIGRLDKPSDGLIFLTNDGDIVNKILRAGNNHEERIRGTSQQAHHRSIHQKDERWRYILDTTNLPCKVTKETKFSFRIVLTQGLTDKFAECAAFDYEVFKLRRVRIMNITLDGIPNGQWRYLTDSEVEQILAMCEHSSGTEDASKTDTHGKTIRRATDAKLFDSREENQGSKSKT